MKKLVLTALIVCATWSKVGAQGPPLEERLSGLPDVAFQKSDSGKYGVIYELKIRQPLDHLDPSRGYFYQRAILTHKGVDRPTVLITEGYDLGIPPNPGSGNRQRISELTDLLAANQIDVEHRFFGTSLPDTLDYGYLNLRQATADYHHIRQLFDQVYSQKWISTGISKGGATTIFYRYFYPNDVDVSVPYVAPINQSLEEPRIYHFLDTIGSDECRSRIKEFQVRILENRAQILPLLKFYSLGAKAQYSYLSLTEAFEYAVMEYPFSFWQFGHSCDKIPAQTASLEEVSEYLISVSDPTFYSDESIRRYNSHYYQAATEMGYYGYETSEFKGLLAELPTDSNPQATFFSFNMTDAFDGQLLNKVHQWLETDGDKFIYIYGGIDTWTASAVAPNDKVDSEWFIMSGKHHRNARIREMNESEKERLVLTLKKWLSMEIDPLPDNK